eukprot:13558934-Alexandrium_andersonii.AAC.1
MSASLVGSEMCIRDRNMQSPAVWTTAAGTLAMTSAAMMAKPSLLGGSCCLLYTSDAADDM